LSQPDLVQLTAKARRVRCTRLQSLLMMDPAGLEFIQGAIKSVSGWADG
jgi:hypothetical protein